jgi:hypothetical protein
MLSMAPPPRSFSIVIPIMSRMDSPPRHFDEVATRKVTVCPIVLRLTLTHPLGFDESTFEIPGDGPSLHAGRLGQQAHLAIGGHAP